MVMANDILALREDTEAIIAVNPVEIVFIRNESVQDQWGNITRKERVLEPQRVRIAEISHSEAEKLALSGISHTHVVNITARHDGDVEKGDVFTFQSNTYRVLFMHDMSIGGVDAEHVYKKSGRAEQLIEDV